LRRVLSDVLNDGAIPDQKDISNNRIRLRVPHCWGPRHNAAPPHKPRLKRHTPKGHFDFGNIRIALRSHDSYYPSCNVHRVPWYLSTPLDAKQLEFLAALGAKVNL